MRANSVIGIWIRLLLLIVAGVVCPVSRAWVPLGKAVWPDGTLPMTLLLGDSAAYSGGQSPNGVAEQGALLWNKYMQRVQVTVSKLGDGTGTGGNGVNEVYFASTYQGEAIQSNVLAFTLNWTRGGGTIRAESDIVVNNTIPWSTYTGPLWYNRVDLTRVIAHEVGHALGLGHPDGAGQRYTAIMNSMVSEVAVPAWDDIEGIANLYGVVTGNAPLIPTIYWISGDKDVEVKEYFSLQMTLSMNESSYTYQWYKDGVAIEGATSMTFTVSSAVLSDAGIYYVEVRGAAGTDRSRDFVVKVRPRTAPTATISSYYTSIYATQSNVFSVSAKGSKPYSYQWQKDGVDIAGATGQYLDINPAKVSDTGSYRVVVSNDVGSCTTEALTLTVKEPPQPVFSSDMIKTLELQEGTSSSFSPYASSPFSIQWQWFKDGVPISNLSSSISFAGVASEAGVYTFTATNIGGSASADLSVSVVRKKEVPLITIAPRSAAYRVGTSLTLSFYEASTLSCQWYKDGLPLAGQTSTNLKLSSLSSADAGEYYVVVKTSGGTTTSTVSSITVMPSFVGSVGAPGHSVTYGGVLYYLQASPASVQRFDLVSGQVLVALPLTTEATQLCVGSAGVVVSDSTGAISLCRAGESQFQLLYQEKFALRCMATLDDQLFWMSSGSSNIQCLAISTKTLQRSSSYFPSYPLYVGMSVSALKKKLTLVGDVSDSYQSFTVDETGLGTAVYSTNSVLGPRVYFDAADTVLTDSNGWQYDTTSQTRLRSVGMPIQSLARLKDGRTYVLAAGRIYLLGDAAVPVLAMDAPAGTVQIFSSDSLVYALVEDASRVASVSKVELGLLSGPLAASVPATLSAVPMSPSEMFLDNAGLLWTVSRTQRVLASWSADTRTVTKAITLRGLPNQAAYSAENNCIYVSYGDRLVTVVDLTKAVLTEKPFVWFGNDVDGLSVQAGFLSVLSFGSQYVYDRQGTFCGRSEYIPVASQSVWDSASRKVYALNWESSPSTIVSYNLNADGGMLALNKLVVSFGIKLAFPLRFSGQTLMLGSGQVLELPSMKLLATLPTGHVDAVCANGSWVTISDGLEGCVVRQWNTALTQVVQSTVLVCRPKRIFALSGSRYLVVGDRYGAPRFVILDANLNVVSITTVPTPSRLANISVQADAGQGMDALVPGFVINGTTQKTLLIRGSGPGLAAFGVSNCLVDPTITLYNQPGAVLDSNDNWGTLTAQRELRERSADLYAFPLAQGSKDAVLLSTLTPGAYSAQVQGTNKGEGRAIVEVYDAEEAPGDSRAVNMSARCKISKDHEAVGGFVIQGDKPKKLLIRAVGPGLIKYSVIGTSADPKLRVFSGSTVIAENNDWSADATKASALKAAFASTGAFSLDAGSKDAALLVELQPGNYTVYMESADGGSGVSILEFYEVE